MHRRFFIFFSRVLWYTIVYFEKTLPKEVLKMKAHIARNQNAGVPLALGWNLSPADRGKLEGMAPAFGMKLLPNHPVSDDDSFGGEQDFSNVPKWKQVLSLVILVLTLLGMIFEKQIGIKLCITGCIGALALILTGVISEKDALKSIDLKTIFLFGGTLSLASALDKTGAGAEIANIVIGALGENPSPYVLTLVVFLLCCVMTNFMSNTATTALMVPICLSIAQGMGADPRAVLMACVIGGSCAYATPIGMPANTMVVSAGGYTFKDYAKAGLPLILIATVVSMVILPIAFPFFPQ